MRSHVATKGENSRQVHLNNLQACAYVLSLPYMEWGKARPYMIEIFDWEDVAWLSSLNTPTIDQNVNPMPVSNNSRHKSSYRLLRRQICLVDMHPPSDLLHFCSRSRIGGISLFDTQIRTCLIEVTRQVIPGPVELGQHRPLQELKLWLDQSLGFLP